MSYPDRDNRRPLALLAALLLCGGLAAMHRHAESVGRSDAVTGLVRDAALVPAQAVTERLGGWWRVHVSSVTAAPRLARENAALRTQVLALSAQNNDLREAQVENDRLRALLRFQKRSPRRLLAAEVVTLKPSAQIDTLTLNRGRRDGVHIQESVLAANGALIGQVLDVTPRACTVLLLTDSGSSVGAQVVARKPGDSSPVGVVQGDRAGHLRLTYLQSNAELRPGAPVTTSGLGGVFPKGLPLGAVTKVTTDKATAVKTALLRPAADFDHLEEAFLLEPESDASSAARPPDARP